MPLERSDVAVVLQRIADTLLRLVSDRVDLAKVEAREEIDRALAIGARLLLAGAACAVGLVLVALATTELLAPLVHARSLRLLIVGAPLIGFGAWRAIGLARSLERSDENDTPQE